MEVVDTQFAEWLAGFWEGDGRLSVEYTTPIAEFKDSDNKDIHKYIRSTLGYGTPLVDLLDFGGQECYDFLNVVKDYLVSPLRLEKVSKVLNCTLEGSSPTLDWLVGLWDADGSSNSSGRQVYLRIGKVDSELISLLKAKFGGKVSLVGTLSTWTLGCIPSEDPTPELYIANYIAANSRKSGRRERLQSNLKDSSVWTSPSSRYGRIGPTREGNTWVVTCSFQTDTKAYPVIGKSYYKARVAALALFLKDFSIPGRPWEYVTTKKGMIRLEVKSMVPRKGSKDFLSERDQLSDFVYGLTSKQKKELKELLMTS